MDRREFIGIGVAASAAIVTPVWAARDIEREAKEWIESFFPVGPSTKIYRSVTGEPYITLAIGGVKQEGHPFPDSYYGEDPDTALLAMKRGFLDYIKDKAGTLYWRQPPLLKQDIYETRGDEEDWSGPPRLAAAPRWKFYTRLLVSDRPPIFSVREIGEITTEEIKRRMRD